MLNYRKNPFIFLCLFFLLLCSSILLPQTPAWAGPKAVLPQMTHDFGQVNEDQQLTHSFVVKNSGSAPLEVLEVDPDCACTVPEYDRRIPPGGQGKITLSIKPFSVVRPFEKKTKIRFNDPEMSQVMLIMKGVARPIIEIQPHHIVRFTGGVGAEYKAQIRFISHQASGAFEISKFETNLTDKIEVTLTPEVPGKVYVLEVKNKTRQAGHYAGKIDLFTNSKQRPRLIVRVFADLYPESLGSP